jgi:hypothetical protein
MNNLTPYQRRIERERRRAAARYREEQERRPKPAQPSISDDAQPPAPKRRKAPERTGPLVVGYSEECPSWYATFGEPAIPADQLGQWVE